mgnify:CR=1 FL=1
MNSENSSHSILVVEDNAGVMDLAVNIFEYAGFKVFTARDAASGVECFRQNPGIDLIFSDLILPGGVTGIEMAKTILKEKPGTLFLLVTGYSDKGKALMAKIQNMDNVEFLAKPYDVDEVTDKVTSMISQRRPSSTIA